MNPLQMEELLPVGWACLLNVDTDSSLISFTSDH
jgi:hypothetical protein